jgi:hypothetical protein
VIDHVRPLACGGRDEPDNMQWQTRAAARAKDRVERAMCGGQLASGRLVLSELKMLDLERNILIAMSNDETRDNQQRKSVKAEWFNVVHPLDIYFNASSRW